MKDKISQTPIFILAGGLGTRLKEETEFRPKPMVPVGNHPILWHIMRWYSHFGFKRFIICSGFKSEVIKSYFLNYASLNSDFTIDIKTNELTVHSIDHEEDWEVTVAYTGELTMTGGRIAIACEKYLGNAENFGVTYGDGLTDVDLADEYEFHISHGKIGTILGSNPPSRFGELRLENDSVVKFAEKPDLHNNWINAGYLFFKRQFVNYLSKDINCVLEKEPLIKLADDKELNIYKHEGFWACMDTQRDLSHLNQLWTSGEAPWDVSKFTI